MRSIAAPLKSTFTPRLVVPTLYKKELEGKASLYHCWAVPQVGFPQGDSYQVWPSVPIVYVAKSQLLDEQQVTELL